MKTNEERFTDGYFYLYLSVSLLALTMLILGCPPGTKTAAEFTVKVTADLCKEDTAAPSSPETVTLDCPKVEGGGTVKIVFPRREWWAIRLRAKGGPLAPDPGK